MKLYTFTDSNDRLIEQVRAENHQQAVDKVQTKGIDNTTAFYSESID